MSEENRNVLQDRISTPFNACSNKEYCESLRVQLQAAKQRADAAESRLVNIGLVVDALRNDITYRDNQLADKEKEIERVGRWNLTLQRKLALQEQLRWRKWPEEKPNKNGLYLVNNGESQPEVEYYDHDKGMGWQIFSCDLKPSFHYMPIPALNPVETKGSDNA